MATSPPSTDCATHGASSALACERCGAFFCGGCIAGAICERCGGRAQRSAAAARREALRRSAAAFLAVAAAFFLLPAVIASGLNALRTGAPAGAMLLFGAIFAVPPALLAVLVLKLGRPWLPWLALPTSALGVVVAAMTSDVLAVSYAGATCLVLFAILQARRWARARASS